jgi:hypothetical protein
MRDNQNFLRELDLNLKINPTLLSSKSVKTACLYKSYRTGLGTTVEIRIDDDKNMRD